ncbi:hypothetical protein CHLRE_13g605300v5 [Chlamydomonas reinhardtii]|uniref:Uncharacterized protein n=1 Tax=Chlamydomonas reinhardtii TaxID=3055 RepID=A0A2K3D1E2_CHLRE|nr:uncharacterized protein CHLRE_13g605300v5 [Chlamydomonas reinhardtii]PNW74356.1 hypothetical protein CHLRE_13g605300v5 [Chlamydomonas reinhardtii]
MPCFGTRYEWTLQRLLLAPRGVSVRTRQGEADRFGAEGPTALPRSGRGGGYPGYISDAKRQHQVTKGDAARFPERSQPQSGYDRDRDASRSLSGGRERERSRERSNVYNRDRERPRSAECRRSPDRREYDRSRHAPQSGAQVWQYDPAVHGAPDPLSPARCQDPEKHIAWLQQAVQWHKHEARTANQECRKLHELLSELQFQLRRKQEAVDKLQSKVNPLERQLQLKTTECVLLQSASSLQQQLRAKSAEGEPPQSVPQRAQQQETPKPSLLASGRLEFLPCAAEPKGPDGGEAVTAQEEEGDVECICGCDPCACFDAAPSNGSNGAEAGELASSQPISERSALEPSAAEHQLPPPPQQSNSGRVAAVTSVSSLATARISSRPTSRRPRRVTRCPARSTSRRRSQPPTTPPSSSRR